MQAPGEGLILKLWETLTEKAIGGLLKSWQIRREGKAHLDLKREELLTLAQAEREAEAIRRGTAPLSLPALNRDSRHAGPIATSVDGGSGEVAKRTLLATAIRQEVNVAKAVLHAEEALAADSSPPPGETLSEDWLYRWRDYAASVSSDDLQQIWGLVLAGETKAPGAFSLRLLNFLHNLDQKDAEVISLAMPFVVGSFIPRNMETILTEAGVTFSVLLHLQNLGVLSAVDGLGISKTYSLQPCEDGKSRLLLTSYDYGIGMTSNTEKKELTVPAYAVTDIGVQISQLRNFGANLPYLRALGGKFKEQGLDVEVGRTVDTDNGRVGILNPEFL